MGEGGALEWPSEARRDGKKGTLDDEDGKSCVTPLFFALH